MFDRKIGYWSLMRYKIEQCYVKLVRKLHPFTNQSIDWRCKSIDWFLYEGKMGHLRVKFPMFFNNNIACIKRILYPTIRFD